MLKKAYKSVTEGKFNDALTRFNALLHIIPLLVVDTRREVDDVKELLGIAKCARYTLCFGVLPLSDFALGVESAEHTQNYSSCRSYTTSSIVRIKITTPCHVLTMTPQCE